MNKYLICLCFLVAIGCKEQAKETAIEKKSLTLFNPASQDVANAPVVIERTSLTQITGVIDENTFPLLKNNKNEVIPFQVDDLDFDGKWDEYAFVVDMKAKDSLELEVVLSTKDAIPAFAPKTHVHFGRKPDENTPVTPMTEATIYKDQLTPYQANQMDGPAWENEYVGYRLYFDGRNMRDVFGKQKPEIVLPKVGLSEDGNPVDNYHVLEDWGRDVLSVGNSIGAGGIALYENEQLIRLGLTRPETIDNVNSTTYKLINTGPVRGIFSVNYEGWQAGDISLSVANIISIWQGSHGYSNKITVTGFEGEKTLAIGLVNSNNDQPVIEKTYANLQAVLTHDKQTYDKEYFLGLALLVPDKDFLGWAEAPDTGNVNTATYAKIKVKAGKSFTYYVFSGWELQDTGFTKSN
ncbi:MAG: DUF4861 domain-containing protein, partial [Bacteroidota bacterium]